MREFYQKFHRCGNIYYIFGHIHHVNVHCCQFFGQVQRFWSYSFGHLDSVKWITLFLSSIIFIVNIGIQNVGSDFHSIILVKVRIERYQVSCFLSWRMSSCQLALKSHGGFVVISTQNHWIKNLFNIIKILFYSKYFKIIESKNLIITST